MSGSLLKVKVRFSGAAAHTCGVLLRFRASGLSDCHDSLMTGALCYSFAEESKHTTKVLWVISISTNDILVKKILCCLYASF